MMESTPSEVLGLKNAENELHRQAKFIKEMTQVTPEKTDWLWVSSYFILCMKRECGEECPLTFNILEQKRPSAQQPICLLSD